MVLVGNKISPGNPVTKPDGTVVRTLWGELAWQLGGKKAFARVKADDEKATSPGDVLRELFKEYGPCLILIDEWVAYARQLHDQSDLPAGGFETQFTFAQALTESAKLARQLPAGDQPARVGHARARRTRRPTTWRWAACAGARRSTGCATWSGAWSRRGGRRAPRRASRSCGGGSSSRSPSRTQFKAARRGRARLRRPLSRAARRSSRPSAASADYEKRIQAAYPIHPEIFDRLYTDWSTLVKFQRTRGVLRLMAAVIHSLWEKGDRNPLILPANDPDRRPARAVRADALPLGQLGADHREGRGRAELAAAADRRRGAEPRQVRTPAGAWRAPSTSARRPRPTAAHRGLEDRRVKLGCVMPGESPAVFGDALRRLAAAATYLYQDGPRYWYSTQPTVTKLAEDRAEQLKRDPDKVAQELDERLRADLRKTGRLRAHPSAAAVRRRTCRTTSTRGWSCCGVEHPVQQGAGQRGRDGGAGRSSSRAATRRASTATRWSSSRPTRRGCRTSTRRCARYLAWESILAEKETLNLDPHQVRQAETQKQAADGAVTARLPETYQWLLVPEQATPQAPVDVAGDPAVRAGRAGRAGEQEAAERRAAGDVASARRCLRMELDDVPLWRGDHVAVKQLVEDFARYLYLPRLAGPEVLVQAIRDGVALLTWQPDTFAYAESYDEAAGRYRGLRGGQIVSLSTPTAPGCW